MAWWLMPRIPDPEVGGSSPNRVKPCCVLEQGTFTPPKSTGNTQEAVAPSQMTEKLFTVKNQSTNREHLHTHESFTVDQIIRGFFVITISSP